MKEVQSNCDLCGGLLSEQTEMALIAGKQTEMKKCLECGMMYSLNQEDDESLVVNQPDWGRIILNFSGIEKREFLFDLLKKKWIDLEGGITQQSLLTGQCFELDDKQKIELIGPIGSYYELENEASKEQGSSYTDKLIQYSTMPQDEIDEVLRP